MSTINDLNISISQMPPDQAFQLILKIRQERLKEPFKKQTKKQTKGKIKINIKPEKDPLAGISKEDLLKMLLGE